MIVDSSALIAILFKEPKAARFASAIGESAVRWLPASCFLESSMLLLGLRGEDGQRDLYLLIARFHMDIIPVTESQARLAREVFKRYGKGRHPAKLSFGDCMSHAVARETGEELLFKGTDFSQTDIAVAAY